MIYQAATAAAAALILLGNISAADLWQSDVVTTNAKDQPAHYNSQRLALDRRGNLCAAYVEANGNSETLCFARQIAGRWRPEPVYELTHSGRTVSGINAHALAVDRDGRPHLYSYLSDYAPGRSIFEERWSFRQTGGWKSHVIRRSENREGGAAMHDPNLAIDGRDYLHVTAYAHAAYGASHRVRHRFYSGFAFDIEALPRPSGKTDSHAANLCVDGENLIHFVYDSTKALHRGDADTNYPDASLFYITRSPRGWSSPETIVRRVGPDPTDTDYFVLSVGLVLDRGSEPHVTYAISKRGRNDPTLVYYAYKDRIGWHNQRVTSIPGSADRSFRVAVTSPVLDESEKPHFAYDSITGTHYASLRNGQWQFEEVPGDLHGFALDRGENVHLLTSRGSELTHYVRRRPAG